MEEDIKILENMIKRLDKNCFDIYRKASNTEDYLGTIIGNEIISLENLIKGYRELEERNNKLALELRIYINETISKSKIRNKIEELEKELTQDITRNDGFAEYREYARDILQELLEEE